MRQRQDTRRTAESTGGWQHDGCPGHDVDKPALINIPMKPGSPGVEAAPSHAARGAACGR